MMRQRNWTFYKVVLYLGLVAAITLLGLMLYATISRLGMLWREMVMQLFLLGALLQTIFYVLCIRLVHYYVPNKLQPATNFSVSFLALLILNSCMAIGLLLILAFAFSDIFLKANSRPKYADYIALFIVSGYTFITIYLSAASIVLKRYNRYQVATDEEDWLSQLGNPSLNQ